MFAGAVLSAQVVLAADISHAPQALVMLDNTADFGASFGAGNLGNTFADKFTFSSVGVNDVDTLVSSIARSSVVGLDITSFGLYTSTDTLVTLGTQLGTGTIDLWSLTTSNLAAGDYYVKVSGMLVSNGSGSFGANINLAPVPEPETYGMLLAGLGALGFLARRRKQDGDAG
jgi:hypothetical protein